MAKKSLKFQIDSPVVLAFILLSTAVTLLDVLFVKFRLIPALFICPGTSALQVNFTGTAFSATIGAFDFKSAASYLKLLLHVFGNNDWTAFFFNSTAILIAGPLLEERYGSPVLALMMFITSLVAGVLTACLSPVPITGASSIVFMMILLAAMTALNKKNVPLTWIALLLLYIAGSFYGIQSYPAPQVLSANAFIAFFQKSIPLFISLAAGMCGSLFGFLVSPKKRSAPKKPAFSAGEDAPDELSI